MKRFSVEKLKENYADFLDQMCEILGLKRPIDIIKLCKVVDEYLKPFETRIAAYKLMLANHKKKSSAHHITDFGVGYRSPFRKLFSALSLQAYDFPFISHAPSFLKVICKP